MATAVSNATVLIFLAKINKLDLLWNKYKKIIIPPHVKQEILVKDSDGILSTALKQFQVMQPTLKRNINLGLGETEAITLCIEHTISDFLSDDKKARNTAQTLNLTTIGTIGILLWNYQSGKLQKKECAELFDTLIKHHYHISTELYVKIRQLINY